MRTRWKIATALAIFAATAPLVWFSVVWVRSLPLVEARKSYESGHYWEAARRAEERLSQGHPDDRRAMLIAARAYARLGMWAEAESFFAQIPLRETEDLRLRAHGLESRRLWTECGLIFEQILHRNPLDGDALQHLAVVRVQQDRAQEGVLLARRLTQIPSSKVVGFVLTGMMENQMLNHERAVQAFEEALRLSPELKGIPTEKTTVLQWLAEALIQLGRAAEAESYAVEVRNNSSGPEPCYIIGQARQQLGDEEGARANWEESVARDPKHVPALRELGQLYLRRNEPAKALEWFERALEIAPDNSAIKYLLVTTHRRLGQVDKANDLNGNTSPSGNSTDRVP